MLERVRLLMRPDGWKAFEALMPDETERSDLLETAAKEYGDVRLVAAYMLELVCDDLRGKAAGASKAVKKVKVGPIEVERQQSAAPFTLQADSFCARAAALRKEVRGAGDFNLQWSSPLHVLGRRS